MKRKLLSVLLTFCLAFSLLPTAALADAGEASGNVAKIDEQGYATLADAVANAKLEDINARLAEMLDVDNCTLSVVKQPDEV